MIDREMMPSFNTRVAGVTFINKESKEDRQQIISRLLASKKLFSGQRLSLRRDFSDPNNQSAIAVIGPDGTQLGNLPPKEAEVLAPKMDDGIRYTAEIISITGGSEHFYGINISVQQDIDAEATGTYNIDAVKCFDKGKKAFDSHDFKTAVELLERAARLGLADAQYWYGVCIDYGYGIEQDHSLAFEYYLKAAKQGCADAEGDLAFDFHYGEGTAIDYEKAFMWYKRAADHGNSQGLIGIGKMYEEGAGVPQNDQSAYEWYRKAAELGNRDAMHNVGIDLLIGRGCTRNPYEAADWNRKAAELDHVKAQFNLAKQYLHADGVPRDQEKALYWIRRAAKNGHPEAINVMRQLGLDY